MNPVLFFAIFVVKKKTKLSFFVKIKRMKDQQKRDNTLISDPLIITYLWQNSDCFHSFVDNYQHSNALNIALKDNKTLVILLHT